MSRWVPVSATWSRVPNRLFGGMQNLTLAPWYFRFQLKSGARSGNYKYKPEGNFKSHSIFMGLECDIRNGWDTGFQFIPDHKSTNAKTPSWQKPGQKRAFCACSCVRLQVINSDGSVSCNIRLNVSIHYRLTTLVHLFIFLKGYYDQKNNSFFLWISKLC